MSLMETNDNMHELIEAVDDLAVAGQIQRSEVVRGLAAMLRKRANFERLRTKLDPRFGDIVSRRKGE